VPAATVEDATTFNTSVPEPGEAMLADANVATRPVGAPVTTSVTADFSEALAVEVIVVCVV
jgi:hypothetical protein